MDLILPIVKDTENIEEVLDEVKKYIKKQEDIDFITRAFDFALEKHEGQIRKSGVPYINHCLSVCYILATLESDPVTIASGFLHDTVEDCGVTLLEINEKFGSEVANIVDIVTKIKKLPHVSFEETSAQTHRKLILALSSDIRGVIVKLCDRLHNMRTLEFVKKEKQARISKETLEVYAPIANRLGMAQIQNELENLSFYYLYPIEYKIVKDLVDKRKEVEKSTINEIIAKVSNEITKKNIKFRIFGRTKHLYSIYKKMYIKHTLFENIYDLQAIRIICQTKEECFVILDILHTMFKEIRERTKDYITHPKSNMYQSLHTTVLDDNGDPYEFQIRTEEMDYIAQRGVAAHFIYKENYNESFLVNQKLSTNQLTWIKDLEKIQDVDNSMSDIEYMEQVQNDLFGKMIYCLTPNGKVIELPQGSTPVDFAYRVHTMVGNTCVGALVNNSIVPLDKELQSGDTVEIKTLKSATPSEDWLRFVKTTTARNQIKKAFAKRNTDDEEEVRKLDALYDKGKHLFEDALVSKYISNDKAYDVLKQQSNLALFNVTSLYDLFILIAQKSISSTSIINRLFSAHQNVASQVDEINKKNFTAKTINSTSNVIIDGMTDGIKIEMANCCRPVPGDSIVGFISQGRAIRIHRKDCPNVIAESKKYIDVHWNENIDETSSYPVDLQIISYDRNNLVLDLMGLFSTLNITVDSINAKSHHEDKTADISCTVYVHDSNMLTYLINKINSISGVLEINRITH